MEAFAQYFHVVFFNIRYIMLCKMVLVFKSVDETLSHVTIQMKAIEQHFHVVLIISQAPATQSRASKL